MLDSRGGVVGVGHEFLGKGGSDAVPARLSDRRKRGTESRPSPLLTGLYGEIGSRWKV